MYAKFVCVYLTISHKSSVHTLHSSLGKLSWDWLAATGCRLQESRFQIVREPPSNLLNVASLGIDRLTDSQSRTVVTAKIVS